MVSFQKLPFRVERSRSDDVGRSLKRPPKAYKSKDLAFTSHTTPRARTPSTMINAMKWIMSFFVTQPNTEPLGPGQPTSCNHRAKLAHDLEMFKLAIAIGTELKAAGACSPDTTLAEIRSVLENRLFEK